MPLNCGRMKGSIKKKSLALKQMIDQQIVECHEQTYSSFSSDSAPCSSFDYTHSAGKRSSVTGRRWMLCTDKN